MEIPHLASDEQNIDGIPTADGRPDLLRLEQSQSEFDEQYEASTCKFLIL